MKKRERQLERKKREKLIDSEFDKQRLNIMTKNRREVEKVMVNKKNDRESERFRNFCRRALKFLVKY